MTERKRQANITRYQIGGYEGNQLQPIVRAILNDADAHPLRRVPLRELIDELQKHLSAFDCASPESGTPTDDNACSCGPVGTRGRRDPHCPKHGEFPVALPSEAALSGSPAEETPRTAFESGECCMVEHANATPPWTCSCSCHRMKDDGANIMLSNERLRRSAPPPDETASLRAEIETLKARIVEADAMRDRRHLVEVSMTPLALSKTLDPADFDSLTAELAIVDSHFGKDRAQHPMRRWEYAMALRAYDTWYQTTQVGGPTYDVGGAGSPFWRMVNPDQTRVIDPDEPHGQSLDAYVGGCPRLGAAVFCLSVLEHVDDLDRFLYHLGCLVAPGGLLFLTFDACGCWKHADGKPETHHFHWMRKRIFDTSSRDWLLDRLLDQSFQLLDQFDASYAGDHVYDYTFASLALVKRP